MVSAMDGHMKEERHKGKGAGSISNVCHEHRRRNFCMVMSALELDWRQWQVPAGLE